MKWIPVTERLPEVGEPNSYNTRYSVNVLVSYSDGSVGIAHFGIQKHFDGNRDFNETWWESPDGYMVYPEVVAWMPKPEPYKITGEKSPSHK